MFNPEKGSSDEPQNQENIEKEVEQENSDDEMAQEGIPRISPEESRELGLVVTQLGGKLNKILPQDMVESIREKNEKGEENLSPEEWLRLMQKRKRINEIMKEWIKNKAEQSRLYEEEKHDDYVSISGLIKKVHKLGGKTRNILPQELIHSIKEKRLKNKNEFSTEEWNYWMKEKKKAKTLMEKWIKNNTPK